MRQNNQDTERRYFEMFAATYPIPAGSVEYKDKPDVRIRGAEVLGIEITRLYSADGEDTAGAGVQRTWRRRVVSGARSHYIESGGPHIQLTVNFNLRCPIADIESAISRLTDVARRINGHPSGPVSRDLFGDLPEVEAIYLTANPCADAEWNVNQVYETQTLDIAKLLECVSRKNELLRQYDLCDRYWLLLVVDPFDEGQDQSLIWPQAARPVSSRFEKILVYSPYLNEFLEVPVCSDGCR